MKIHLLITILLFLIVGLYVGYIISCTYSKSNAVEETTKNRFLQNSRKWLIEGIKERDPLKKAIKINYSSAYIYMLDVIDSKIVDSKLRDKVFSERDRSFDIRVRYLPLQKIVNTVSY